ncbi:hypothetical protein [Halorussus halobius]|uniref:hypothetical protein n=1 Tax=Halorussus halobius TaxID=1710537 RepID=UPI001092134E|nr:hypothetical protein [Halorussus halobius]
MGILEIHFHDAQFEWTFDAGTDDERSFAVGTGSDSRSERGGSGDAAGPSAASKLRSVGLVALVVGAAVALGRFRSRRARAAAESDRDSGTGSRLRSLTR